MNVEAVTKVVEAAASSLGLTFRQEWHGEATLAVQSMAKHQRRTADQMASELPYNREMLAEISQYLTVGETFFLRYPTHFDLLANHVARIWDQEPTRSLTVWSAGCSTGEEPYSVALAVAELCGRQRLSALHILATDTNPQVIERAREASYSPWSFRGVSDELMARHFNLHVPSQRRMPHESLRACVSFRCAALDQHMLDIPDATVDIVLFRNVGIYLVPAYLDRLFAGFRRTLRPDGLLIVAPSDPRPSSQLFARVEHDSTSVYRPHLGPSIEPVGALEPSTSPVGRNAEAVPKRKRIRPTFTPPLSAVAQPAKLVVARSPVTPVVASSYEQVEALAEQGMIVEALAALDGLGSQLESNVKHQILRGRLFLAAGESDQATEQLRKVLYLDAGAHMARFWYIIALRQAGQHVQAQTQAQELHQRLSCLQASLCLDGTPMTAGQLRTAVSQWLEK